VPDLSSDVFILAIFSAVLPVFFFRVASASFSSLLRERQQ